VVRVIHGPPAHFHSSHHTIRANEVCLEDISTVHGHAAVFHHDVDFSALHGLDLASLHESRCYGASLGLGQGGWVLSLPFGRQRCGLLLSGSSGLSRLGRLGGIHEDGMGL
jgi:hypothetical protein